VKWPGKTLVRRFGPVLVIGLYLGLTGYFLLFQILGVPVESPVGYFWTWDMFPTHECFSVRSVAIGRTATGKFVKIFPGPAQRYRWGAGGGLTRTERNPDAGERLIQKTLTLRADADASDPIVYAYLMEQYWPVRFNYPDKLYDSLYDRPHPNRRYWRIVREFDVSNSRLVSPGAGT